MDLTALLHTNVKIKGQNFVIDEGPLVAEVFRSDRETDNRTNQTRIAGDLYYSYVFPVRVDSTNRSEFLVRLILQNNGRLSGTKRATFSELKDEEFLPSKKLWPLSVRMGHRVDVTL